MIRLVVGTLFILIFLLLVREFGEREMWRNIGRFLWEHPIHLLIGMSFYFVSFLLKAYAWKIALQNRISFKTSLVGIWYSLALNHLLPIKGGEVARVYIGHSRGKNLSLSETVQSVAFIRFLDMFSLLLLTLVFGYTFFQYLSLQWMWLVGMFFLLILVSGLVLVKWPEMVKRQWSIFKKLFIHWKTVNVTILIFLSWVLEGSILFAVMDAIQQGFTYSNALMTNSVTVLGQVFQITPGGIANYETVMSVTLRGLGVPFEVGLFVAMVTHGLKFLFSYIVGIIAWSLDPISWKQLKLFARREKERE
ncbi:lysylphosphatidylglycerol synthase transmembrane domain-containing protein [Bacillus sp. 2205SS5-2]|uniref:lysylphosphatidylglycerol synthase transmembrane domain-containing protein n=1 Tax=Bacillus sp. 2205SS5-2 TaxID=3109031 RepID=UPI0030070DCE